MKSRRSMVVLLVALSIIYLSGPSRILAHATQPEKQGGGCVWPVNPPEESGWMLVSSRALPVLSLVGLAVLFVALVAWKPGLRSGQTDRRGRVPG